MNVVQRLQSHNKIWQENRFFITNTFKFNAVSCEVNEIWCFFYNEWEDNNTVVENVTVRPIMVLLRNYYCVVVNILTFYGSVAKFISNF